MDRNKKNIKLFLMYSAFWVSFVAALYLGYAVYFVDLTSTKSKWVSLFAALVAILLAFCKFTENIYNTNIENNFLRFMKASMAAFHCVFRKTFKYFFFLTLLFIMLIAKLITPICAVCFLIGAIIGVVLSYFNSKNMLCMSANEAYDFQNEFSFKKMFNYSIATSLLSLGVLIAPFAILFHIYKDYQVVLFYALGFTFAQIFVSNLFIILKKIFKNAQKAMMASNFDDKLNGINILEISQSMLSGVTNPNYQFVDLLTSFICVAIANMCIGNMCLNLMGLFLPIIIISNALFAAILSCLVIKISKTTDYIKTFVILNIFLNLFFLILSYHTILIWLPTYINIFYAILIGTIAGCAILFKAISKIFYFDRATARIANASITGVSNLMLQLAKETFKTSIFPIVLVGVCIISSFYVSYGFETPLLGLFGVTLSVLALTVTIGVILLFCNFAYGLVNLHDISFQLETNYDFKLIKEAGNKLIDVVKKYSNFSLVAVVVAMLLAYCVTAGIQEVDLVNPYVFSSIFFGFSLPFICLVLNVNLTLKTVKKMMFEIKKQIKVFSFDVENLPYINFNLLKLTTGFSSFDFSEKFLLIFAVFFALGKFFKYEAIAGFIVGLLFASIAFVFIATNINIFLDGAKKYFENEFHNAKESNEYALIDFLGDVFNDICNLFAPLVASLVKLITVFTLALIPIFV